MLKTDIDGKTLFVGEWESYNPSIFKFDISGDNPIFTAEGDYNNIGNYLKDFTISPIYDEIYVASGYPWELQVVESNSLEFITLLESGVTPVGLCPYGAGMDIDGFFVYATPSDSYRKNMLYQFSTEDGSIAFHYNLISEVSEGASLVRGIDIDRSGKRAFIIHGSSYDEPHYKVQVVELNNFIDSDRDGLSDQIEERNCTDPHDADSDDDGIIDSLEDLNQNGQVDSNETDPCDADSDDDGIPDGQEDTNYNGHVDTGETDPLDSDTDNDGMPDGWEIFNDLNPLFDDADEDFDGDKFSNIKEYEENTDPNDYQSHPPRALPWLPLLLGDD